MFTPLRALPLVGFPVGSQGVQSSSGTLAGRVSGLCRCGLRGMFLALVLGIGAGSGTLWAQFAPLDAGQSVPGFQDDFTGATRNTNWPFSDSMVAFSVITGLRMI